MIGFKVVKKRKSGPVQPRKPGAKLPKGQALKEMMKNKKNKKVKPGMIKPAVISATVAQRRKMMVDKSKAVIKNTMKNDSVSRGLTGVSPVAVVETKPKKKNYNKPFTPEQRIIHNGKMREYYQKNRDKVITNAKNYYHANKDTVLKRQYDKRNGTDGLHKLL